MERELRCDRCNTLNSPGVTYCVKCGRLLPSISTNLQHRPTVWELEQVPDDSGTVSQNRNKRPDSEQHARYIVKCPQCGTVIETHGGVLPMTCNACGYFFQTG